MRFKLSQLTLAIMAAALYSTSAIAADKSDDFYIEIKGPESSVQQQPLQQTSPAAKPKTTGGKIARPYVPDRDGGAGLTIESKTYGPVKNTDTTWSIANKIKRLYPGQGITTRKVIQALQRKNPRAFASGSPESLLAGYRLSIPSLSEIKSASASKPVAKPVVKTAVANKENTQDIKTLLVETPKAVSSATATNVTTTAPVNVSSAQGTTVIASTEPSLIDSKVSELVSGSGSNAVSTAPVSTATATVDTGTQVENEALAAENKELKEKIQQLNSQIGSMQANMQTQEQLQQEISALQEQLKAQQEQSAKAPEDKQPDATTETKQDESDKGMWQDILATPLNLLLLISLPVLAVLVVLSFWLRSRAKQELAAREQEMAESTALMMDETESDFGDLLTVDLSKDDETSFPDLNLEDESLIPSTVAAEHELASEVERAEPAIVVSDVIPEIQESTVDEPQIDLDVLAQEEAEIETSSVAGSSDFASLLSDADLAQALESDFAFSATEPEPEPEPEPESEPAATVGSDVDLAPQDLELSDAELASMLNLNKVMAEPGLQMSDQVVSEPDVWELPSDGQDADTLAATLAPNVNLQEVHNDADKSWLQQFEPEQKNDASAEDYLSIDALLAQADQQEVGSVSNPDAIQPNLDIGLDEFPDVLPQHDGIDIDDDGGVGAKLDLARAYLEIDDKDSAKELLLEVQSSGSNEQIKEAEKLLSRIG